MNPQIQSYLTHEFFAFFRSNLDTTETIPVLVMNASR